MTRPCCDNVLDAIGDTPLVRLRRVAAGLPVELFAKLEFMNPSGSIKDRIARYMIEKAEKDGRIRDGWLIIENSSGNTALGLALVAVQKGYRLKVVVRDRTSQEKVELLEALGVQVKRVDSSIPPESPDSYNNITPRLARELPNCYFPDQHNNRENNEAHYHSTGPEIWEQMEGRIDYFVAAVGTGGTICGVGRYLKERDPKIKIIGIDVEGSVFTDYFKRGKSVPARPYLLEGVGDEFLIKTMEFDLLDDMLQFSDCQAFLTTRELARVEGILAGGSSGAALFGALAVARSLDRTPDRPARIVTVFPDGAARYLSTLFNDDWMREKGFL